MNRVVGRGSATIATLAMLVACGACGSSDDSALSAASLNGQTFVSTTVTGHDLVAGTKVTLTFRDANLSANAGCNTMNATYTLDHSTLRWSGPVQSTMMGCPSAVAAQDQWLTTFLETGAQASLAGSALTLASGQTVMELQQQ